MAKVQLTFEQLDMLVSSDEASGSYFDMKFAEQFAGLADRGDETEVLGIVRKQADDFFRQDHHRMLCARAQKGKS